LTYIYDYVDNMIRYVRYYVRYYVVLNNYNVSQ